MGRLVAVLGAGAGCAVVWAGVTAGVATAATPSLQIAASAPHCAGGHTTVTLEVHGAVPGQAYALYGTSGYQASDPFTATAADFSTSVQINHGYLGLTGDLESTDRSSTSNQIDVPDTCPRVTNVVDPVTPSPTMITHTDVLSIPAPTTAPPRHSVARAQATSTGRTPTPSVAHPVSDTTSAAPSVATSAAGSWPSTGAAAHTADGHSSWPSVAAIIGAALILGSLVAGFAVRRRTGR